MGGSACVLIIHALVRYEEVPAKPHEQVELESQLRQCYANPTIAAAVAEDEAKAIEMYEVLEKHHLTPIDLKRLLGGLDAYK
jgi:hypothetical protein